MKRNRTQLFCGSLYLESLRQLRLMGLIYLACCLIFTVLPTLLSSLPPSYRSPSAAEFAPILYLCRCGGCMFWWRRSRWRIPPLAI